MPKWLVHTEAHEDGMGLADWVFPGFLFIVGLSIPFAFLSRQNKKESQAKILLHIFIRTLSLLIIGVFMVNVERLNPLITGMSTNLWAILVYISIFLVWNKYPKKSKLTSLFIGLKVIGIIGLVILAIIFKSGTAENPEWLITSWWGILGLIGWGYLAASLTFFFTKGSLPKIIAVWVFFVVLNALSQFNLINVWSPLKIIFGVLINGTTPSIVLCGLIIGVLLNKYKNDHRKFIGVIIRCGLGVLLIGFLLRKWFIISKIMGTPSWAMICNGISILVFCMFFFIIDWKRNTKWTGVFKLAGQNSLTTYLAPDVLYYLIWAAPLNILFYKQDTMVWLAIFGSLAWAILMIGFATLLSKIHIRLKL